MIKLMQMSLGEPNGGKNENCGEILNGGWNDQNCLQKHPFICKMKGKESGDPIIPDTTTAVPYPNCGSGSGWVEDPVSSLLTPSQELQFLRCLESHESQGDCGNRSLWFLNIIV